MLCYERSTSIKPYKDLIPTIKPSVKNQIVQDNAFLLNERITTDPKYYEFLRNLLLHDYRYVVINLKDNICSFQAIRLATIVLFDVILYAQRKYSDFNKWIIDLTERYQNHIPACKWLLSLLYSSHSHWLKYLLYECPDRSVRESFRIFIGQVFLTAFDEDEERSLFESSAYENDLVMGASTTKLYNIDINKPEPDAFELDDILVCAPFIDYLLVIVCLL